MIPVRVSNTASTGSATGSTSYDDTFSGARLVRAVLRQIGLAFRMRQEFVVGPLAQAYNLHSNHEDHDGPNEQSHQHRHGQSS